MLQHFPSVFLHSGLVVATIGDGGAERTNERSGLGGEGNCPVRPNADALVLLTM